MMQQGWPTAFGLIMHHKQECMKGRIVKHQVNAKEQHLDNESSSGLPYIKGTVTTTKWKAYNDCTM